MLMRKEGIVAMAVERELADRLADKLEDARVMLYDYSDLLYDVEEDGGKERLRVSGLCGSIKELLREWAEQAG